MYVIPVDQIRTGRGRGQCTEASIASVLEVPLEAVPDLWAGPEVPEDAPDEDHQPMELRERLWAWMLKEFGVVEIGVHFTDYPRNPLSAWAAAVQFFQDHFGIDLTKPEHEYQLLIGPNPDGHSHQVVGHRGIVVHDPNPSRRGITECTHVAWLLPITLVPAEVRHMPSICWDIRAVSSESAE